jgi:hypothetical protein
MTTFRVTTIGTEALEGVGRPVIRGNRREYWKENEGFGDRNGDEMYPFWMPFLSGSKIVLSYWVILMVNALQQTTSSHQSELHLWRSRSLPFIEAVDSASDTLGPAAAFDTEESGVASHQLPLKILPYREHTSRRWRAGGPGTPNQIALSTLEPEKERLVFLLVGGECHH